MRTRFLALVERNMEWDKEECRPTPSSSINVWFLALRRMRVMKLKDSQRKEAGGGV